ncbi:polysaccharide deacetylase family protein [Massilia sp. HP4]|uniref:polysaccharide deacetylase family protein n=1 Tax=Massilia sp. HP4 TaxID=2562316 RepID=UPI0010C04751|nr:polysaccharide deacetylase family protein [Massilia sp. HP4]
MSIAALRPKIAVLYLARCLGLFALGRHLTAKRLRILCYHGGCLGDELGYNPKLFMSTETFRKRIAWLQTKGYSPVRLDDAVRTPDANRGRLEVVVTFDDGWYSTGRELLPVLAGQQIPSTLYLCTRHFLEGWPVLNVATRYLLWKAARRRVKLEGFGAKVDGEHDLAIPAARESLAQGVVAAFAPLATDRSAVCAALERLATAVGLDPAELDLASRRFDYMTPEEVRSAAASGCAIELHGHDHYYPRGAPERFRADLSRCDEVITGLGLPKPRHYCYPSGSFDEGAAVVLDELGVASATTCLPGLVHDSSPPNSFYLSRFLDGESIHQLEFEAEMSGFADFLRRLKGRRFSLPVAAKPKTSAPTPAGDAFPK